MQKVDWYVSKLPPIQFVHMSKDLHNDIVGIPLSSSESSIPYDLVPLKSTTLETATARLFLANNLAGYDTPLNTSLAISSTTSTTPSSNSFVAVVKTYSIAIRLVCSSLVKVFVFCLK